MSNKEYNIKYISLKWYRQLFLTCICNFKCDHWFRISPKTFRDSIHIFVFRSRERHYLSKTDCNGEREKDTMESFVRPNNARYRRILYPTIGSRIATSRYNNTADRFWYCCEEKTEGLLDDLARFITRRKTWLLCEKYHVLSHTLVSVSA